MHYLSLLVFSEFNCDNGWDLFGKFCYKFVKTAKSKTDAENYCIVKGAHLASIHCKEEMDFLTQKTTGMNVWVGGERKGKGTLFQWLDGTKFDYENWDSGEPNDNGFFSSENCLALSFHIFGKPGKWQDWSCENKFEFLCKKSAFGNCNSVNSMKHF